MKQLVMILSLISLLLSCSDRRCLITEINSIISEKELTLGVAIYDLKDGQIAAINADRSFPMQSVYKFHIALAMLNKVDRGIFSLSDSIVVKQSQLQPKTWSPFRDHYPNGHTTTLATLIEYMVINSDNNISDLIMDMVGGPTALQNYLLENNIPNTNICSYERDLQSDWKLQFLNYTTPNSVVELLRKFHNNELLDDYTNRFLWDIMSRSYTGTIRDSLPRGITIAHKSGFSGVGEDGIIAANNDIGIMRLPNNREIIFSIFITESKESPQESYKIISRIAATIYSYYK